MLEIAAKIVIYGSLVLYAVSLGENISTKSKMLVGAVFVLLVAAVLWKLDQQSADTYPPGTSISQPAPGGTLGGDDSTVGQREIGIAQSDEIAETDERVVVPTVLSPAKKPMGPLAERFADIEQQAALGDLTLAFSFSRALSLCSNTPRTVDKYEERKRDLYETHTNQYGNRVRDFDRALADLASSYTYCKGLADDQIDRAGYWLWFAASNGSLEAQTFFRSILISDPESNANKEIWGDAQGHAEMGLYYLKEAAVAGSGNAMTLYALHLMDLEEADRVEAAAFLYAASRLYASRDAPDSPRQKMARDALTELSAFEESEARRRAEALLSADSCCVIFDR